MAAAPDLLDRILPLVRRAGEAIREIDHARVQVETKDDRSPVTAADHAANALLVRGLGALFPDVPVLSEESQAVPYPERRGWSSFFLVDPLDGTKEFLRGSGEYTVNVALMQAGRPAAGVVGVPAEDRYYLGMVGAGAARVDGEGPAETIQVGRPAGSDVLRVVASRSHRDAETEAFLARLPEHRTIACGSSLKICRIAEGGADLYPRFGPTMEWDTAAAHAVLAAAGGEIVSLSDHTPLLYNKSDLHNPGFIAAGDLDPRPLFLREEPT